MLVGGSPKLAPFNKPWLFKAGPQPGFFGGPPPKWRLAELRPQGPGQSVWVPDVWFLLMEVLFCFCFCWFFFLIL